jgi:DNA polymerase III sliding clamp (beta) subunit (PCNA family)
MSGVFIDFPRRVAVATDGYILSRVRLPDDLELEDGETVPDFGVNVPTAACKELAKIKDWDKPWGNGDGHRSITFFKSDGQTMMGVDMGSASRSYKCEKLDVPDYSQIIPSPERRKDDTVFCFNFELLAKIAKSTKQKQKHVTFSVGKPLDPIRVFMNGIEEMDCLLMPIRGASVPAAHRGLEVVQQAEEA